SYCLMSTTRPRRPWRSLADYGGSSRAAESSDKPVTRASLLVGDHWRHPDARYSPGRSIRLRNVGEDTANLGPQARRERTTTSYSAWNLPPKQGASSFGVGSIRCRPRGEALSSEGADVLR